MIRLMLAVIILLSILICGGCDDSTLEKVASRLIGLPIPMPDYLPEGYEVSSIDVGGNSQNEFWNITSVFDDVNSENAITLVIDWFPFLNKFRDDENRIEVNGNRASYFKTDDFSRLRWNDDESRMLELTAAPYFEFGELMKIAESITTPPARIMEVHSKPERHLMVTRGDSQNVTITVRNNSSEKIKVQLSGPGIIAEGINVIPFETCITLKSGETRDIMFTVSVSDSADSPAWPYRSFEEAAPEGYPPQHFSGMPYYQFGFTCNYERNDKVTEYLGSLVWYLRIDSTEPLPPGMITDKEVRNTISYPVNILLPAYLPENINPPKWYEKSGDAPYTVTAYYEGIEFIMAPEPGVSEPPDSFTGEKTVIRNRTVVIGENRIDWWYYGIYFSLVSETIPMSELMLMAKSTMMVEFSSTGWFDVD